MTHSTYLVDPPVRCRGCERMTPQLDLVVDATSVDDPVCPSCALVRAGRPMVKRHRKGLRLLHSEPTHTGAPAEKSRPAQASRFSSSLGPTGRANRARERRRRPRVEVIVDGRLT